MLDLTRTHALHEQLAARLRDDPAAVRQAQEASQDAIRGSGVRFEGAHDLRLSLSALVLNGDDIEWLQAVAEQVHAVVEQALDWVMADPARMRRWFPAHQRIFPYLTRTRGLASWQGYSRYDAVITPTGRLKLLELNTCCPAGFFHAAACNDVTLQSLRRLGLAGGQPPLVSAALEADALVDALLAVEQASGLKPAAVALLNDENGLQNELDLLETEFTKRGRLVVRGDAGHLQYDGQTPRLDGKCVSLSYNKIRVSTPHSPNHRWGPGFEQRYAAFLAALRDGALVSINNTVAATLGEDKGLLQLLHAPEFGETLDESQRRLVGDVVLRTVALRTGEPLPAEVLNQRERYVIKPANEGRGFGVQVGRFLTDAQWAEACRPPPGLPCVVQEYCEPLTLCVPNDRSEPTPMHLTIAMGLVLGRYRGLFSRISPEPITNLGRSGILQAVLRTGGD